MAQLQVNTPINSAWVEAPYEVSFLFGFRVPRLMSRKRGRHWQRQKRRSLLRKLAASRVHPSYLEVDWASERSWIVRP